MPSRLVSFILVALLFSSHADQAYSQKAIVTLETCALDTVTFVDPWAKGEFRVQKVGSNHFYLCGDTYEKRPSKEGQDCTGPYGQLVLEGRLNRYSGDPVVSAYAVWNTIKGAPCCWWDVFREQTDVTALRQPQFKWLSGDAVPRLKDLSFATIDTDETYSNKEAGEVFGNDKIAMRCFTR